MPESTAPKRSQYVIPRLWRYLYAQKWLLFLSFALTISSNLLALVGPMLSGLAINEIEPGAGQVRFDAVLRYAVLMLACYAASAALTYWLSRVMIRLSQRVVYQMRRDVFDHLMDLPIGYFNQNKTGDIVSRISYDIDTVNASLSSDLLQILTSIITVLGSLGMMLAISPVLVSVFAVTIPVSLLFTRYMTGKVRPMFKKRSKRLGELNGFVEEVISGQKTTKAYHQEHTMTDRFDGKNDEAVEAYYDADFYSSATGPGVNFVNNLSLSLISALGALLYLFGRITLGNLSSFVLYSRKFSGPINEAANIVSELQSALAAAERIFRLIDAEPEPADAPDARPVVRSAGNVRMEHVRFGYTPGRVILEDLSLDAPSGSLTAIVGPTGAGKTTLINLLMRFYDVQGGRILVDGADIRTLTRKSLRLSFSMVLQDTWLFQGTVFDNIAYGKKGATAEEVERAARAAQIHDFIMQLPDGYGTVLSDEGTNLSKGQKQLLTIARAMLLDAEMLILDEATSNVDTRTEQLIQTAMRNLMRGKTCFVIAHRLSTIQNADHILVVRDGAVVEQGTHSELLGQNGFYARLYRSQFE